MSTYVFLGPTLALAAAEPILGAVYLPPIRQGDLYRLVELRQPLRVALIDGYFSQVPAVWHKEILWALRSGVEVFGAASMGALRAAELADFGMQGIGRIAEAYRTGVLDPYTGEPFEDDDEVAVSHAPPEMGYRCLSEAMVNIRLTLAAACAAGVLDRETRDNLCGLAKRLFYPRRSYTRLLSEARRADLPQEQISALESWLPAGRLDQKHLDAVQLLQELRQDEQPRASTAGGGVFAFQHTVQWQTAREAAMASVPAGSGALDELRLDAPRYLQVRRQALDRVLAVADEAGAEPLGPQPSGDGAASGDAAMDAALSGCHGSPERVEDHWCRQLQLRELARFAELLPESLLDRHMVLVLRSAGELQVLEARARHKGEWLRQHPPPALEAISGLRELQLHDWYFGRRLERGIPADLATYVHSLGYADVDAFNRALLAEYVYLERERTGPQTSER